MIPNVENQEITNIGNNIPEKQKSEIGQPKSSHCRILGFLEFITENHF